jgi:hypothetical protein
MPNHHNVALLKKVLNKDPTNNTPASVQILIDANLKTYLNKRNKTIRSQTK